MQCLKGCAQFLDLKDDEERRLRRWQGLDLDTLPREALRPLVAQGVPRGLRWRLWRRFLRSEAPHTAPGAAPCEARKDAERTSLGGERLTAQQAESLWKVCAAYASYNPEIGYCQGMNFLVAVLLVVSGEQTRSATSSHW